MPRYHNLEPLTTREAFGKLTVDELKSLAALIGSVPTKKGDLVFLKASAKNTAKSNGQSIGNATTRAVELLHRHKMLVVGGLIVSQVFRQKP